MTKRKMGEHRTAERELLAEAWQNYRERVLHFIRSRTESQEIAEDILQDMFLKLVESEKGEGSRLRDRGSLRAWMYTAARNSITDHYRRQGRVERLAEELGGALADVDTIDIQGDQNQSEGIPGLSGCLEPFIDSLPEPYRRALIDADLKGITQQEIARREGISLSGAKSRVQRARQMVRSAILTCCRVEFDARGRLQRAHRRDDCSCERGEAVERACDEQREGESLFPQA